MIAMVLSLAIAQTALITTFKEHVKAAHGHVKDCSAAWKAGDEKAASIACSLGCIEAVRARVARTEIAQPTAEVTSWEKTLAETEASLADGLSDMSLKETL